MYKLDRKTSVVFDAAKEELRIVLDLTGDTRMEHELLAEAFSRARTLTLIPVHEGNDLVVTATLQTPGIVERAKHNLENRIRAEEGRPSIEEEAATAKQNAAAKAAAAAGPGPVVDTLATQRAEAIEYVKSMGYDQGEAERIVSVEGIGNVLEKKQDAARWIAQTPSSRPLRVPDMGKASSATASAPSALPTPEPSKTTETPSPTSSADSTKSASDSDAGITGKEPEKVQ